MRDQRLAVRRDDARRLLPAMLQRVEARYARVAASGCPKTPTTPHSSWNLSVIVSRSAESTRGPRPGKPAPAPATAEASLEDPPPPLARRSRPADSTRSSMTRLCPRTSPSTVSGTSSRRARSRRRREVLPPHRHQHAGLALAEQQGVRPHAALDATRAPSRGPAEAALGERHGEAALGDVVRGAQEALLRRRRGPRRWRRFSASRSIHGGGAAHEPMDHGQVLGAAELLARAPEQDDDVALRLPPRRQVRSRRRRAGPPWRSSASAECSGPRSRCRSSRCR